MGTLTALGVFSGLALNLLLEFGLDLWYVVDKKQRPVWFLAIQSAILFVSVISVWLFFSLILNPLALGFVEIVIIMPLSVIVYRGIEKLAGFFFSIKPEKEEEPSLPAYGGFAFAASYLTIRLASSFGEALVLALGFSSGILAAILVIKEIDKRSKLEAVPRFLKGSPLLLVSMGLLSIIASSAAVVILTSLGVF